MANTRYTASGTQAQIQDMFGQSAAIMAQPNVQTFERFERRGGLSQAMIFVMVAALVSGVIAAVFAPFHHDVSVLGQLLSRLIDIPVEFLIFTGAVYLIGKNIFRGTGTYNEVAYTFALFFVPLSIIGTLIGIVPILGWLVTLVIGVVMAYFGYLAVQSSMNLRDNTSALATLILSTLAYLLVGGLISSWLLSLFVVGHTVVR